MLKILIKYAGDVREMDVQDSDVIVGRSADREVVIPDKTISRKHCRIWEEDGQWFAQDLGSNNGTGLNGELIEGVAEVKVGDELRIGPATVIITEMPSMSAVQAAADEIEEIEEFADEQPEASEEIEEISADASESDEGEIEEIEEDASGKESDDDAEEDSDLGDEEEATEQLLRFEIVPEDGEPTDREMTGTELVIGRSKKVEVHVPDPLLSRQHCKIEKTEEGYRVVDLESGNGTQVNEEPITEAPLAEGDEIKIGTTILRITSIEGFESSADEVLSKIEARKRFNAGEDSQAVKAVQVLMKNKVGLAIAAAALLVVLVGGGFVYSAINSDNNAKFLYESALRTASVDLSQAMREYNDVMEAYPESEYAEWARARVAEIREQQQHLAEAEAALESIKGRKMEFHMNPDAVMAAVEDAIDIYSDTPVIEGLVALRRDFRNKLTTARADFFQRAVAAYQLHLAERNYAEAINSITENQALVTDPIQRAELDVHLKTVREKAMADYREITFEANTLEAKKEYAKASKVYRDNADRFKGTAYYAIAHSRVEGLELLASSGGNLAEAHRAELAAARQLKQTLSGDIQKLAVLLKKREFLKAEAVIDEIIAKAGDNEVLVEEYTAIKEQIQNKTVLFRTLVDAINDGRFKDKSLSIYGVNGKPVKADPVSLALSTGSSSPTNVPWEAVSPKVMYSLYIAMDLSGDNWFRLANFCYDNGLKKEGAEALYKFGGNDPSVDVKAKIDAYLARIRHLPQVPNGGFAYFKEMWVTQGERNDLLALDALQKPLKKLATARTESAMDRAFEDVYELYDKDGVSTAVKDRIRDEIVTALNDAKKEQITAITKKARPSAKLGDLKNKLNAARENAMKTIFDKKIYPDEDHGRVGQPTVDKAVNKVKALWENPGAVVIKNDKNVTKMIEQVVAISRKYLAKLGVQPDPNEFQDMQDLVINSQEDTLNIRTYALTQEERDIMEWNKEVDKFNQAFKGVGEDIKEQVRITNDYREMMGLGKVKLNMKLHKAAQKHSAAQAAEGRIWHNGSNGTPKSRCAAEGYKNPVGENCALGYGSPEGAHNGWYNSSGHHRNILTKMWDELGVGHTGNVWVQNFGGSWKGKKRK